MKKIFTKHHLNAQLLIQPKKLTVLRLESQTQVQVTDAGIWLTHSQIARDHVLHQNECVILPAGLVLIEAVGDTPAFVCVRSDVPTSLVRRFWNGVKLWLNVRAVFLGLKRVVH